MKIPIAKLGAMIRYFGTYTDPSLLGKKKLMKLFYFVDFVHVKNYASPITYDNYVHLEHGPIPSTIMNLVTSVETDPDNAILIQSMSIETSVNSNLKKIVPKSLFTDKDNDFFSPSEIKIMKEVSQRFKEKNGKFIEDSSHEENAWSSTAELEDIAYTLAVGDPDCLVEKEEIELALRVMS